MWTVVPGEIKKNVLVSKFLNLKSRNGNQVAPVGYAKLIYNMLVFFKYAHMYTSIQMYILYKDIYIRYMYIIYIYVYIYLTIAIIIVSFCCQDIFIHMDDFSFNVAVIFA